VECIAWDLTLQEQCLWAPGTNSCRAGVFEYGQALQQPNIAAYLFDQHAFGTNRDLICPLKQSQSSSFDWNAFGYTAESRNSRKYPVSALPGPGFSQPGGNMGVVPQYLHSAVQCTACAPTILLFFNGSMQVFFQN
jgi:hypothetical protein